MPSISQNRLRLAPMTGAQALAAVLQPGGRLVTDEVAAAIVRFVAGGAELTNAEVEPSLLSLICRELNDARIAQGRKEISLDLLAGSHATILSNFYQRVLADQSPAVREIIEDDLLTSSGFRENVAEERLVSRFQAAGAAPVTLATLVNRRLLRIEERLDVRRVELTHDVLCGVVKNSRDVRREREAREETEKLLADQRARELAARRALVRARQIAIGCTVLAAGALIAAILAVLSTQRARRAELEAQQARSGAEHLLGYLTDDFVRELEGFGRLNVVAEFSQRQIDYFHALPPALKGAETTRNGALAMVHDARAMRILGDLDSAGANAAEAVRLLEQLRQRGDHSEATTIALALGYAIQAQILDNRNDAAGAVRGKQAADLLEPLAESPHASVAARGAYVEVLVRRGYEQQNDNQNEDAVRSEQEAMRLAIQLGARDHSNIDMGAAYAEAGAWLVTALQNLGRNDEARRVGEDAVALADKVLERRPGYRLALHAQQVIEGGLGSVAQNDLNPSEAARFAERNVQVSLTLLGLDYFAQATAAGAGQIILYSYVAILVAHIQAQLGDEAGVAATLAGVTPFVAELRHGEAKGSMAPVIVEAIGKAGAADDALERDDLVTARRIASDAMNQVQAINPQRGLQEVQKYVTLFVAADVAGHAEYLLGNYPAAEQAEREAIEARKKYLTESTGDRRDLVEKSTWLAMSLALQGRLEEASQVIGPVVKFHRELAAKNQGDRWQPVELAGALYAQALTDKKQGSALLHEAAALVDTAPAELRALHDVRLWRARIHQAQQGVE